ncbi:Cdc25 phosphatase Ibp1 [Coemansia sp. RSA 552]|nr:Cdc25 phosphatase Ibp1 [Coemansia sp. RSA 552]
MNTPSYISVQELAKLVRDPEKQPGVDYAIIDVRTDDRHSGYIPGSDNSVTADKMHERARAQLVDKYRAVPLVVFHCMMSQVRGPKSARIYKELVHERLAYAESSDPQRNQHVKVLRGGFREWAEAFLHTEPALVEGFNQDVWEASLW